MTREDTTLPLGETSRQPVESALRPSDLIKLFSAHNTLEKTADLTIILFTEYTRLLQEIDEWFNRCQALHPEDIVCAKGCSECCRGLFDITILDAALLKEGLERLPEEIRVKVSTKAKERLKQIRSTWPGFSQPFVLNIRPEEEREELMASDNATPCVLLDDVGRCLLYDFRPMTCRLHGLPLLDISGEIMESEWCTNNFTKNDPLHQESLRGPFNRLLSEEALLGRFFTKELFGQVIYEVDTLIPTALLIDFKNFDWHGWLAKNPLKT